MIPSYRPTDPGQRRHFISILQLQSANPPAFDRGGAAAPVPAVFLQTWAKIMPARATDVIRNGQTVSQTYLVLNIRYRSGITANMQVQANNGTYVIQGIENVEERNVELNLMCLALGSANQ